MAEKYFWEAFQNAHCDARFFKGELTDEERGIVLANLLKSFSKACDACEVRPILMHGGLIGWYWNGELLPWDNDIDICILWEEFEDLQSGIEKQSGNYIFDINPDYRNRVSLNVHSRQSREPNRIDARYIDSRNGCFIDITILSRGDDWEVYGTKCPHYFDSANLFPLIHSEFCGCDVFVPYNVKAILEAEYGPKVFDQRHHGYLFDQRTRSWINDATSPA